MKRWLNYHEDRRSGLGYVDQPFTPITTTPARRAFVQAWLDAWRAMPAIHKAAWHALPRVVKRELDLLPGPEMAAKVAQIVAEKSADIFPTKEV